MSPREFCLGVIDGRQEGEKLELACRETQSGTLEVELRLLAWGEGIGWYPQRTLPLPPELAHLRALLRRAERLTGRQRGAGEVGARVLPFPRTGELAAG